MLMGSQDDIAAVHRAWEAGEFVGAIAEARRRWPIIRDDALAEFVDRILRMPPDPGSACWRFQSIRPGIPIQIRPPIPIRFRPPFPN